MTFGTNYLCVNGKKLNMGEVTRLVENISENIILNGFTSSETLSGAIHVRCYNNRALKIKVLNRLIVIFTDNIEKESKITMYKDDISAVNNVVNGLEKVKIIADVLQKVVMCEDAEEEDDDLEIISEALDTKEDN